MSKPSSSLDRTGTPILPLPEEVISQIKSSTAITSLSDVVYGLLENALDAQATRIEITIDFRRGGCKIEDNGLGIAPSEFQEAGGLGRMHYTSKRRDMYASNVHGGTGTFLASLAALSLITITSRHHQHYSHNTLVLHRAKPIVRLTPAPIQHRIQGSSYGTRIVVRDLFGNMPVRVKQRVILADTSLDLEKCWQALKRKAVALLLPWVRAVTVHIFDGEDRSRAFTLSTKASLAPNDSNGEGVDDLVQTTPRFDPKYIVSILAQAGYVSLGSRDTWVPVFLSTLSMSVRGLISLEPSPNKATQFISIGIRPCADEDGHGELYDNINNIFAQSSFGAIENDSNPDQTYLDRIMNDRRHTRDKTTSTLRKGGRKSVDRWPRFFFRIEGKPNWSDSSFHFQSLINVLEALVAQWLEANHFRPRKRRRDKSPLRESLLSLSGQVPSDSSTARSRPISSEGSSEIRISTCQGVFRQAPVQCPVETALPQRHNKLSRSATSADPRSDPGNLRLQTPFTEWSRIKSGNNAGYQDLRKCSNRLVGLESLASVDTASPAIQKQSLFADGPNSADPSSIRGRTSVTAPEVRRASIDDEEALRQPAGMNTQSFAVDRPLRLQRRVNTPTGSEPSPWLRDLFKEWKNPVFVDPSEPLIPTALFEGLGDENGGTDQSCRHDASLSSLQADRRFATQMSKMSLPDAQVVSQVDNKFILLKMPSKSANEDEQVNGARQLLVLVDQHAASERCILESLFSELCQPNTDAHPTKSGMGLRSLIQTSKLARPLHYQISIHEGLMFNTNATHFASWGILYNLQESSHVASGGRESTLSIITVPPGIVERCKTEPRLLIELLRAEIHALVEAPRVTSQEPGRTADPEDPYSWVHRIGSCPRGIIDMLNSRACRSALMFNDQLSVLECRELIRDLAKCAFPFMCAHGRVSMVPMVYLGGPDEEQVSTGIGVFEHTSKSDMKHTFAQAFKRWRHKESEQEA